MRLVRVFFPMAKSRKTKGGNALRKTAFKSSKLATKSQFKPIIIHKRRPIGEVSSSDAVCYNPVASGRRAPLKASPSTVKCLDVRFKDMSTRTAPNESHLVRQNKSTKNITQNVMKIFSKKGNLKTQKVSINDTSVVRDTSKCDNNSQKIISKAYDDEILVKSNGVFKTPIKPKMVNEPSVDVCQKPITAVNSDVCKVVEEVSSDTGRRKKIKTSPESNNIEEGSKNTDSLIGVFAKLYSANKIDINSMTLCLIALICPQSLSVVADLLLAKKSKSQKIKGLELAMQALSLAKKHFYNLKNVNGKFNKPTTRKSIKNQKEKQRLLSLVGNIKVPEQKLVHFEIKVDCGYKVAKSMLKVFGEVDESLITGLQRIKGNEYIILCNKAEAVKLQNSVEIKEVGKITTISRDFYQSLQAVLISFAAKGMVKTRGMQKRSKLKGLHESVCSGDISQGYESFCNLKEEITQNE